MTFYVRYYLCLQPLGIKPKAKHTYIFWRYVTMAQPRNSAPVLLTQGKIDVNATLTFPGILPSPISWLGDFQHLIHLVSSSVP